MGNSDSHHKHHHRNPHNSSRKNSCRGVDPNVENFFNVTGEMFFFLTKTQIITLLCNMNKLFT